MGKHEHPSDSDFSDLEEKLASLRPKGPEESFARKLGRELDALERDRVERKVVWKRFVPVAAAAGIVLVLSLSLRSQLEQKATLAAEENDVLSTHESRPPAAVKTSGQFVPVSSGNFIHRAAEGPIIGVENGKPVREWRIEVEDTWHWHDPETNTNLRIFQPREEIILVPLETD